MTVSVVILEIFSVKEWPDLENRVRVHSRSLEMALFDRSRMSSYSSSIATMAISCIVCDIHHHLEIYSAPITFAAICAVQKSYEQQTLTNVKSKGKIMGF